MSVEATRWAWRQQGLPAAVKLVLLALADRAGADHMAYPSQQTLGVDTGLDRKTIMRALCALRDANLLVDSGERRGNTKRVVVYQLACVSRGGGGRAEIGPKTGPLTVPKTGPLQKGNSPKNGTLNSPKNGTLNSPKNGTQNYKEELPEEPTRTIMLKPPFSDFWSAYPKRVAKGRAETTWNNLSRKDREAALAHLATAPFAQTPARFIPYPSTYLRARRWEDEPAVDPFDEWLQREEHIVEDKFRREH